MKKFLLTLLVAVTVLASAAQVKDSDPQLIQRLNKYMQLSKDLKFDQLMDYTYPALFKIAPKEAILQSFEQAYNNEEMQIVIDSIAIQSIGPDFRQQEARFKKIDYFMSIRLRYKDTALLADADFKNRMLKGLEGGFPGKTINYNDKDHSFAVAGTEMMFAIKEAPVAAWMFIGYNKNPELIKALFPQAVIDHFKLL